MAANTRKVKTSAEVNTQMDDDNMNPTVKGTPAGTAAGGPGNRKVIHITLIADGVDVSGNDIFDMVDAQFATVQGEKDTHTRGTYIFQVGPA